MTWGRSNVEQLKVSTNHRSASGLAEQILIFRYLVFGEEATVPLGEGQIFRASRRVVSRVVRKREATKPACGRLRDADSGEGWHCFLEPFLRSSLDGSLIDGAGGTVERAWASCRSFESRRCRRGVLETLKRGKGNVQEGLSDYSRDVFAQRAAAIVREALATL